ncbi:hypothetical protein N9Y92_04115 [Chlamydiales bacterium]|nr:hypothetical protein [Chlamydiales bacterium]
MYKKTDEVISNESWCVRFSSWIREFTISPSSIRCQVENDQVVEYFYGFSKRKYEEEFGNTNCFKEYGPPIRMVPSEDQMELYLQGAFVS